MLKMLGSQFAQFLPQWICLVVSARPETNLAYELRALNPTSITLDPKEQNDDIENILEKLVADHVEEVHQARGLKVLRDKTLGQCL